MIDQVKSNYGLWKRVPREEYHPFRNYKAKYDEVNYNIGDELIVKVKIRYEDVGRVVHNGGKIRCFKMEILD